MGRNGPTLQKIPVAGPNLSSLERRFLLKAFDSGWISGRGQFIEKFEKAFAQYIGVKYALTCSSGTSALHLALLALEVKQRDEVLVPDLTYIAVPNAVSYCNALPIMCDIDPATWNIDPKDIRSRISRESVAIIAVHLYGNPCDMNELMALKKKHGLYLIEDCSESLGSTYKGKPTGAFGDVAVFSFFANKTITTGEGGMVCTNNRKLAERIDKLRNQWVSSGYNHGGIGYNYRMTNLQAAIGLAQLERIDGLIKTKMRNSKIYDGYLDSKMFEKQQSTEHSFFVPWMYAVKGRFPSEKFVKYMAKRGVEAKQVFTPVTRQNPYLEKTRKYSNKISSTGICFPSGTNLKPSQIRKVAQLASGFRSNS